MAVNRYDQAYVAPYVEQYTPIPFDTLLKVGQVYNQQRDLASQALADYNKNIREFSSPIEQDIEDYYNTAMNPTIKGLVQEAYDNPDALKSFEFRSRLQNAINNVDYAKLGLLQQSAENAIAYQDQIRKMAARGEYNPNWDNVDFSRYRTLNNGVFNETSPIQFQTLQSIVNPYVKNLKSTFYGGVDPLSGTRMPYTNWMAVTDNEIKNALSARYYDIINTPQGAMWYRDIASQVLQSNPNATAEEIDNAFMSALTSAASQYKHSEPLVDQVGLAMYKENRKDARETNNLPEGTIVPLTETITTRGNQLYNAFSTALFSSLAASNPQISQRLTELNNQYKQAEEKGDQTKMTEIIKQRAELQAKSGYGLTDYVGYILSQGKESNSNYVTGDQLNNNINAVANYLTVPYEGQDMTQAVQQAMPNVVNSENVGLNSTLATSNVGDYNLLRNVIMSVGGKAYTPNSPTLRVSNYLKNNNIKSYITGTRGYITTPAGNLNVTYQAISEEDLLPLSHDKDGNTYNPLTMDEDQIKQCKQHLSSLMTKAGFKRVTANKVIKVTTTADYNANNPQGKDKGNISTTYSGGGTYWEAEFTNLIPQTSDMSGGVDINNVYDRLKLGQTGARDIYGTRQSQADRAAEYEE